jgi:hypothetical protein
MSDLSAQWTTSVALQNLENSREVRGAGRGNRPADSWLAAMVEGLNELIKEAFDQMKQDSQNVSKDDPRTMTDFQVSSQIFSLLMNTAQTVVKTIGEANANAARKQ